MTNKLNRIPSDEKYWKDCQLRKLMKIILRILKRKTENLNLENNLWKDSSILFDLSLKRNSLTDPIPYSILIRYRNGGNVEVDLSNARIRSDPIREPKRSNQCASLIFERGHDRIPRASSERLTTSSRTWTWPCFLFLGCEEGIQAL